MKELIEYLGKNVRITGTNGKTYEGHTNFYNPPADNDDNLAEIVLETKYRNITFMENEIAKIEAI